MKMDTLDKDREKLKKTFQRCKRYQKNIEQHYGIHLEDNENDGSLESN